LKRIIKLEPDNLLFSGTKALTQFEVKRYSFNIHDNGSRVDVEIILRRVFSYHLTNTFIPTTSLLVIVEVTLFFKEPQTKLAIGLSLTIMLVMYTMYQSINESLSKTAYLKMIDYWLLFCLLVPFIIFLIEIYWLLNPNMEKKESNKSWFPFKTGKSKSRAKIQLLVPALTALFIVFYIIIAVYIY
jgi:hypothetical protein